MLCAQARQIALGDNLGLDLITKLNIIVSPYIIDAVTTYLIQDLYYCIFYDVVKVRFKKFNYLRFRRSFTLIMKFFIL